MRLIPSQGNYPTCPNIFAFPEHYSSSNAQPWNYLMRLQKSYSNLIVTTQFESRLFEVQTAIESCPIDQHGTSKDPAQNRSNSSTFLRTEEPNCDFGIEFHCQ